MTDLEINYKIKERSDEMIEKHGSIENALTFLKNDLSEMIDSWSMFSSDCLGHGIMCTNLLIKYLEKKYD